MISDNTPTNIELSRYFPSLLRAVRSLSYIFEMSNFEIKQKEFEDLIAALKHVEAFGFYQCTIKVDQKCDFSAVEDTNINRIWLIS